MNPLIRLFALGLILAFVAVIGYLVWSPQDIKIPATDYESCTKVEGAKILLSEPSKCITSDGFVFIEGQ